MIRQFSKRKVALFVAATLVAAGSVHAAVVDNPCRAEIGFDTTLDATTTTAGRDLLLPGSAWDAVKQNNAYFVYNRKTIALPACEVKVVVSTERKAPTKSFYVAGPMTPDECSLFSYLSSIDSKMSQGKVLEALTSATAMISKIDGLAATGKLRDAGYSEIRAAAEVVQQCIDQLP